LIKRRKEFGQQDTKRRKVFGLDAYHSYNRLEWRIKEKKLQGDKEVSAKVIEKKKE